MHVSASGTGLTVVLDSSTDDERWRHRRACQDGSRE
jgi:hypothetical protein